MGAREIGIIAALSKSASERRRRFLTKVRHARGELVRPCHSALFEVRVEPAEQPPKRGVAEAPVPGGDTAAIADRAEHALDGALIFARLAQRPLARPRLGDGWVAINNSAKDRVFDVEGGHPAPGTPVIQHPWGGGTNQMWQFVDFNIVIGEGFDAKR